MAYTTKDEIQADFKDITFDSSSNVTDTDVTQFIVESDALINSYIGAKYQTPVSAGEGLQMLKLYSRCLVAARIKRLLEVKQQTSTDANQNVMTTLFSPTQVIKFLEDIRDDKLPLPGASLISSTGGFFSSNYSNSVCPVVKKDEKQW